MVLSDDAHELQVKAFTTNIQRRDRRKATKRARVHHRCAVPEKSVHSPRLLLPKKRLVLVDEAGGGGFWIWEAVGARDWRMEYVRCILIDVQGREWIMVDDC